LLGSSLTTRMSSFNTHDPDNAHKSPKPANEDDDSKLQVGANEGTPTLTRILPTTMHAACAEPSGESCAIPDAKETNRLLADTEPLVDVEDSCPSSDDIDIDIDSQRSNMR
jgi:hypothetical protein